MIQARRTDAGGKLDRASAVQRRLEPAETLRIRVGGGLRRDDGLLRKHLRPSQCSSISVRADEVSGRCFIDVFSFRSFDADRAAAVAVEHFGGTPTPRVLQR